MITTIQEIVTPRIIMDIINKIWLRFSTENSTKQSKIIVQQTTKVKPMLKAGISV